MPVRFPRFRPSTLDVALIALAVLVASTSLTYPFGGDQAIHFYVGREWASHGALPYRDAFDYKTPGIFALHALLYAVFGAAEWPIRLAEIACVLALGATCARLVTSPRPRGTVGFACASAVVVYFGFFSYWDTAQCEIWCVTLAFAALAAGRSTSRHAPAIAGALAAASLLMKPVALLLVAIAAVDCVARRAHGRARATLSYALSGGAVVGLVAAYFAACGGLGHAIDVLVGANAQYVLGARAIHSGAELARACAELARWFFPASALVLACAPLVLIARRGDAAARGEIALAFVLLVAAFVGVALQLKFYRYHYGLLVGPMTLVLTTAFARTAPSASRGWYAAGWTVTVVLSLVTSGTPFRHWRLSATRGLELATGRIDEDEFARLHTVPPIGFDLGASRAVATWLRARAAPDDELVVRGFHAEIYALSGLRFGAGRFFWTSVLTDEARAYRRDDWLAEDRRALSSRPPRFAVAHARARPEGVASPAFLERLGYARAAQFGDLVVLERSSSFGSANLSTCAAGSPCLR